MKKKNVIFLPPKMKLMGDLKEFLSGQSALEVVEFDCPPNEINLDEFIPLLPALILFSDSDKAIKFLSFFDEELKNTFSRMLIYTEKELGRKEIVRMKQYRVNDMLHGRITLKSLAFKVSYHLKALPDTWGGDDPKEDLLDEDPSANENVDSNDIENASETVSDSGEIVENIKSDEQEVVEPLSDVHDIDEKRENKVEEIEEVEEVEISVEKAPPASSPLGGGNGRLIASGKNIESESLINYCDDMIKLIERLKKTIGEVEVPSREDLEAFDRLHGMCVERSHIDEINSLPIFLLISRKIRNGLETIKSHLLMDVMLEVIKGSFDVAIDWVNRVKQDRSALLATQDNIAFFKRLMWMADKIDARNKIAPTDSKSSTHLYKSILKQLDVKHFE